MSAITVFNVFYNPNLGNTGGSGVKDTFIGTALSVQEVQDLCSNYDCGDDWDPYFTIIPVSSDQA